MQYVPRGSSTNHECQMQLSQDLIHYLLISHEYVIGVRACPWLLALYMVVRIFNIHCTAAFTYTYTCFDKYHTVVCTATCVTWYLFSNALRSNTESCLTNYIATILELTMYSILYIVRWLILDPVMKVMWRALARETCHAFTM